MGRRDSHLLLLAPEASHVERRVGQQLGVLGRIDSPIPTTKGDEGGGWGWGVCLAEGEIRRCPHPQCFPSCFFPEMDKKVEDLFGFIRIYYLNLYLSTIEVCRIHTHMYVDMYVRILLHKYVHRSRVEYHSNIQKSIYLSIYVLSLTYSSWDLQWAIEAAGEVRML